MLVKTHKIFTGLTVLSLRIPLDVCRPELVLPFFSCDTNCLLRRAARINPCRQQKHHEVFPAPLCHHEPGTARPAAKAAPVWGEKTHCRAAPLQQLSFSRITATGLHPPRGTRGLAQSWGATGCRHLQHDLLAAEVDACFFGEAGGQPKL